MCVVKELIINVDSFPSQGRLHLLLIILSGTAKMHFNIFLFNRTVVQATQQNFEVLPTQNTFCVGTITHFLCMEEEQADAI